MKLVVLDIGGTSIKYAKYEDGILKNFSERSTDAKKGGAYVVQNAVEIIQSLKPFDGIGISTAGQVDSASGCIRYANENIPGYTGMKIREILENEFGVPTAVENDVNAAALGEGYFGAAKGMSEYLCLTYGTGVGGAVVIDGKIFKGFAGSAGEFGSMIIHGEEVRQGVRMSGCYEDYASTSALVRRVSKEAVQVANGREVFEHIDMPEVKRVVDDWIQEIAHGLVTLIHVFNPRSVIIGGGVMVQEYVAESVRTVVSERIMPSFRDVEISVASLGNKAGLWGAVYIAEQKLKIPETTIL